MGAIDGPAGGTEGMEGAGVCGAEGSDEAADFEPPYLPAHGGALTGLLLAPGSLAHGGAHDGLEAAEPDGGGLDGAEPAGGIGGAFAGAAGAGAAEAVDGALSFGIDSPASCEPSPSACLRIGSETDEGWAGGFLTSVSVAWMLTADGGLRMK